MRTCWSAVVALVVVCGLAPTVRAEGKIVVVDMQRALNECDAGRKAKEQVKSKFERAQDDLRRQREDLDRRKEDYDKKALVLKEDDRRSAEKELEQRATEFKRKYEDFQRDLKRTDGELTSGIVEQLYSVVQDLGAERSYSLVLEASSGALLYSDKSNDITDEVVKLHNSGGGRNASKRKGGDDD
jgi:outer membrane protein